MEKSNAVATSPWASSRFHVTICPGPFLGRRPAEDLKKQTNEIPLHAPQDSYNKKDSLAVWLRG